MEKAYLLTSVTFLTQVKSTLLWISMPKLIIIHSCLEPMAREGSCHGWSWWRIIPQYGMCGSWTCVITCYTCSWWCLQCHTDISSLKYYHMVYTLLCSNHSDQHYLLYSNAFLGGIIISDNGIRCYIILLNFVFYSIHIIECTYIFSLNKSCKNSCHSHAC